MRVGLTYNLRGEQPSAEPALPDCDAEFDTAENIDLLAAAIASLGYDVCRIGNVQDLVRFVAAGQTVDIVFNMAEGQRTRSREAQVPAILEAFGIPYTGSDPLTVALCLDKAMTKRIWQSAGLPTPDFRVVSHLAELDQARLDQSPERWPDLPLFVKPVHEGASKGIGTESIVRSEPELRERVDWTLTRYRQPALV
ncbi:MAG: D-alanine--D-alanine ligase, partial [Chloroflexi bacterium]|nr:D-alanine--D-alanine ligase [Chloroflexota bacterium]